MIFNLYKQRGETPLECITRFAKATPELKGQKMTYMGRLDPLAEGVLLMASGEDVHRKGEFLGLDKDYDFTAFFGFATDTYDVLGKILRAEKLENLDENEVRKVAEVYEGEREQKYPEYSSRMLSKTSPSPLLAQEGEGSGFPSPEQGEGEGGVFKKITIYKLNFHKLDQLSNKELFGRLLMDISKVQGDFRQNQILELWKEILVSRGVLDTYFLGKFSAYVSSGTYIRSLVNDLGNTLGCGATTLSIKRNRVGDYKIEDSIK